MKDKKIKKAMAKNVFIICTIRSATQEYLDKLEKYVSDLESSGINVYAPHRDTNQMALGYEICKQNMQGIIDADEVHIFYNSKSQGTHFDMGMAFALNKNIVIVENEELTEGKSFQRMLVEWQQSAQPLVSGSTGSERIICAAVWYKEIPIKKEIPFESTNPKNCPTGLVFSGHRHGQCIYTKCAVTGLRDAESGENEQGFLTSKNRFVSREEALIIALRENQVMDIKEIRGNRLFSEDLY